MIEKIKNRKLFDTLLNLIQEFIRKNNIKVPKKKKYNKYSYQTEKRVQLNNLTNEK